MEQYLFILGRTPDLALAELKTFFPDASFVLNGVVAQTSLAVQPDSIEKLGGTVKIAKVVGRIHEVEAGALAKYVDSAGSFGISMYGSGKVSRHILEDIKKLIHGSRFVEARDGSTLSSVVVEKDHVAELILVKGADGYTVARTVAVQPFESWSKRDYGRPFADPKAGMLPPKVSRMAVNIAGIGKGKTLLDPFCGMGTILAEALLMGWNVVGSDLSAGVVEKAKGNLRWLMEFNKLGVTYRLQVSDAVHVSTVIDHESIDAIVTEPFMGDPDARPEQVKNIIKGLEKLYIGCLKDWHKILKPQGIIVMALPQYQLKGKSYFVKKVIDMCEILGYTIQAGPIEYSRPQAVVRRNFFVFKKK